MAASIRIADRNKGTHNKGVRLEAEPRFLVALPELIIKHPCAAACASGAMHEQPMLNRAIFVLAMDEAQSSRMFPGAQINMALCIQRGEEIIMGINHRLFGSRHGFQADFGEVNI